MARENAAAPGPFPGGRGRLRIAPERIGARATL